MPIGAVGANPPTGVGEASGTAAGTGTAGATGGVTTGRGATCGTTTGSLANEATSASTDGVVRGRFSSGSSDSMSFMPPWVASHLASRSGLHSDNCRARCLGRQ